MDAVYQKIKRAASDVGDKISAGNQETDSLGKELAARSEMNRAAESATSTPKEPNPVPATPSAVDKVTHPPVKGEKRIPESDIKEWTKPLGTYDEGGEVDDDEVKRQNTNLSPKQRQDLTMMSEISKMFGGGGMVPSAMTKDKGGKVNINDGKHVLGILKEGERVLTPEQNKKWEADHKKDGSMAAECYDEGGSVHTPEEKAHFARSMHKLHGGALHRHLGIPEDQPIPMAKKQEAANSDNPHVAAMGRMAVAMHGWKHPKKS